MNAFFPAAGRLYSTPERSSLTGIVLEGGKLKVTKLAADAKVSKGLASIFLGELRKMGLVLEGKKEGMRLADNALVRQLKRLHNLSHFDFSPARKLKPEAIILYGSWAEGTNDRESDVDLCVTTDKPPKEADIAEAAGAMSRKINADVHILALDKEKLASLKRNSPAFYYLLAYNGILLEGKPLEA